MSDGPSILFVDAGGQGHAPWGRFGKGYWTSAVHLGIAGLAASCRSAGFDRVSLADCRRLSGPEAFDAMLKARSPDVIAFSARSIDMAVVPELAARARRLLPGSARILGGVHATVAPSRSLPPLFHTIVQGEGELVLPRLLERLASEGLDGLPSRVRGEEVDLDALPFPWRDLYGLDEATALASFPGLIPTPMVGILTSRGCAHSCRFCQPTPRRLFGRMRQRSAENVVAELLDLRRRLPFAAVKIYDDSFLANAAFLDAFCPAVGRSLPPLTWLGQARCKDVIRQRDRLAALRAMGLELLILGAETGSPRLLELLHKGSSVEDTEEAVALCHRHGIRVVLNVMLGLPTETDEDRRATVELLRRLAPVIPSVAYYTPMPGSVLSTWCRRKGLILSERPEHALRSPDRSKIHGQDHRLLDRYLAEIMGQVSPLPGLAGLARWIYGRSRSYPRLRQGLAHAWGRWQRLRR